MKPFGDPAKKADVWVSPYVTRQGALVDGYWRKRPRVVPVQGHFKTLRLRRGYRMKFVYVYPYKRRKLSTEQGQPAPNLPLLASTPRIRHISPLLPAG